MVNSRVISFKIGHFSSGHSACHMSLWGEGTGNCRETNYNSKSVLKFAVNVSGMA